MEVDSALRFQLYVWDRRETVEFEFRNVRGVRIAVIVGPCGFQRVSIESGVQGANQHVPPSKMPLKPLAAGHARR